MMHTFGVMSFAMTSIPVAHQAIVREILSCRYRYMVPKWLLVFAEALPGVMITCRMLWYRSSALTGSPCSDPPTSCLAAMLCASCSNFSPLPLPLPAAPVPPRNNRSKVPSYAHKLINDSSMSNQQSPEAAED